MGADTANAADNGRNGGVATTWSAGEYPLMAELLRPAAVAAVERADVRSGDRVVDVATGTGNVALLAAERNAEVVGVDFEPSLLRDAATTFGGSWSRRALGGCRRGRAPRLRTLGERRVLGIRCHVRNRSRSGRL